MGCSDAIHGWMTGRMDGKLHEKRLRCPLLYVIGTGARQVLPFNSNSKNEKCSHKTLKILLFV
jgi:hypothetical protein